MSALRLAINGGEPIRRAPWPPPHFVDASDETRLLEALRQTNWSNNRLVQDFEGRFAQFCGSAHALLVTNATHALKLALLAAGIGPGDEVIIPGVTWPSVPIAILECGADPVSADIEPDTYAISRRKIECVLSSKTKAVIPTHLFCSQADLPPILELGRKLGIAVIEDAAHASGAMRLGKALGSYGVAGIFSFNQKKLLACGEAGCLITSDDGLYERALSYREVQSEDPSSPSRLSITSKVSEFQAAVLLSQLEKLPIRVNLIAQRLEFIRERLNRLPGIQVLAQLPGMETPTAYSLCMRVTNPATNIAWFRRALGAELGLTMAGAYVPLSEICAIHSTQDRRYSHLARKLQVRLHNSMRAHYHEAVRFPCFVLTGSEADACDIVKAIDKVLSYKPLGE